MFVATVFIILILLLFTFASGIIKKFSGSDVGILTEKKSELELNMQEYLESFVRLTNFRFLLNEEDAAGKKINTLKEALDKSGVEG